MSVSQEEVLEVQGEQAPVRAPEAALHRFGVVAEEGIHLSPSSGTRGSRSMRAGST
jgi:hypothetical protein